ncbi:hypothetical protein FSOLCH5_007303 [Fusarium solani]
MCQGDQTNPQEPPPSRTFRLIELSFPNGTPDDRLQYTLSLRHRVQVHILPQQPGNPRGLVEKLIARSRHAIWRKFVSPSFLLYCETPVPVWVHVLRRKQSDEC